jgi:predicted dehydrogenase
MKITFHSVIILLGTIMNLATPAAAVSQLNIALAGLSHDHVSGILQRYSSKQVNIVGIAESDPVLVSRYKERFRLADSLFYTDLKTLLNAKRPQAVMAFNAISGHLSVVEACAPLGIHVMVEKPLAFSEKDAQRMAALARQHRIHLLTNYETTWYASNQYLYRKINDSGSIGPIRKMIVHDGHQGPQEIGVSKQFLSWLTDPKQNGGGALIDFGCYGANLMTWLMKGETPLAVTAVTRQIKPDIYPNVDDEAIILVEYPQASGIIEASWNWPFNIKDMEVFGKTGYLHAMDHNSVRIKERSNQPYSGFDLKEAQAPYDDYVSYLEAVINGRIDSKGDLSSLENNLVVVRILDAARRSAKEGKRIILKK